MDFYQLPPSEIHSLIVTQDDSFEVASDGVWKHSKESTLCCLRPDFPCPFTPFKVDHDGVIFGDGSGNIFTLNGKRFVPQPQRELGVTPPSPGLPKGTVLYRPTGWVGQWQKLVLRRDSYWQSDRRQYRINCPHDRLCKKKLPSPLSGGETLTFKGENYIYNINEKRFVQYE